MAENRVTQLVLELLNDNAASARTSQYSVEVLEEGAALARTSQLCVEVLINYNTQGPRLQSV